MAETPRKDAPPPPKSDAEKTTAQETKDTQAAMLKRSDGPGGETRWGESSDPTVHKILAEIEALQQNREAAGGEPDKELIARYDEEIAAKYHQLDNLGKPETAKLQEQLRVAEAKGDIPEVGALKAKLEGRDRS